MPGGEHFKTALRQLLVSSVSRQVGCDEGLFGLSEMDATYLVSVASRLAFSNEPKDNATAYTIVSRVLEMYGEAYPGIVEAARIILARLGNFPAYSVTGDRFKTRKGYEVSLGDLEIISRHIENTVQLRETPVLLTDFQYRLYDVRSKWHSVSVSAPTSAGKSFLLSLDIVRFFLHNRGKTVVILVPTRALIRQVMRDVIEKLNEYDLGNVHVSCIPDSVDPKLIEAGQVLVFTQERLTTLLNDKTQEVEIGLLIVDEAQEIEDDSRGIVLQTAIERTLRANGQADVLFACPLRSNPSFLLSLFGRSPEGSYFTEENSPVNQNIILVHPIARQEWEARLELVHEKEHIEIGTIKMKKEYRGNDDVLQANAVLSLTREGERSIVYANRPSTAEDVAIALARQLPEITKSQKRIRDVITFVKQHVHPKHLLIQALQHGVAFHYGDMPDVVRMGIEDLFREGHIQYICCTSTLLQGVNLPAKNVFMYCPTKGTGKPLRGGSFWNLAGRAGRMRHEFGGNVYCLMPDKWESKPFDEDKLVPLEAALANTLEASPQQLIDVISNNAHPSEPKGMRTEEQAFGKLFSDIAANRQPELPPTLSETAKESLQKITDLCRDLADKATIPLDIFERNSGVSPHRIEELARYLRRQDRLTDLIPLHPETKGSLDQLKHIFEVCNTVFFKQANEQYLFFARLSFFWMLGRSLKDEIAYYLNENNIEDDPKKIADAVRKLLKQLGNDIRFRYVKYLRVYYDVLEHILTERKLDALLSKMSPLHLYMEYGACTQSLIHLMALGVSRATALLYVKAASMPPTMSAEDVEQRFEMLDPQSIRLPAICRNEVQVLRRKVAVN